jgi:hypothetical protein
MIPQSKIYFKGSSKPIVVSYNEATKVSKAITDDYVSADTNLQLGGNIFKKFTVDRVSILKDLPDPQLERDEDTKRFYEEERVHRESALKDQTRHIQLDFFKLMCQCIGLEFTYELGQKAVEKQREFFAAHPRRVLCSPKTFYTIFPEGWKGKLGTPDNGLGLIDLKSELRGSGIRLIGLAVGRDMRLANDFE